MEPKNTELGGTAVQLKHTIIVATTAEQLHKTVKMITNWITANNPTMVARQCIQDYFDKKAEELEYNKFLSSLSQ